MVDKSKLVRKAIMSTMPLQPESARAAYSIVTGTQISEEQWRQVGSLSEENWEECVELYSVVQKTEDILKEQYENHLASR